MSWVFDGGSGGSGGGDSGIPPQYKFTVGESGELRLESVNDDNALVSAFDLSGSFFRESVSTGVGSYHLGGSGAGGIAHSISSAGQNVGFKNEYSQSNEDDKVFWFPHWQGVSTDGSTVYEPTTLAEARLVDVEPNGAVGVADTPYDFQTTIASNFTVFSVEVVVSEDYDGHLDNVIVVAGTDIYSTPVDISFLSGETVKIKYKYPFFARTGDTLRLKLLKADGTPLSVKAGANDEAIPYRKLSVRAFEDQPVFKVEPVSEDKTLIAGGWFAADTSGGGFTITVNSEDIKRSFTVFDANQSFSSSNPCTIAFNEGQGSAVLQTKNDSYLFYYDSSAALGSRWKYLDLNSKTGGTV